MPRVILYTDIAPLDLGMSLLLISIKIVYSGHVTITETVLVGVWRGTE